MSDSGLTSSQISAAGAYAQADRLVVSIPVRAIDPTRQRFQVEDQASAQDAPAKAQSGADAADGDGSSSSSTSSQSRPSTGRTGFGLIGAVTSFLARMFGQGDAGQVAATTSAQNGAQAYAQAAGALTTEDGGAEILPPSFPRLASGRAIDLVI